MIHLTYDAVPPGWKYASPRCEAPEDCCRILPPHRCQPCRIAFGVAGR